MIVLNGGPHDSCHFQWDEFAPPKEVLLKGRDLHVTAVYALDRRKNGHWRFTFRGIRHETGPRLVRFVRYNE